MRILLNAGIILLATVVSAAAAQPTTATAERLKNARQLIASAQKGKPGNYAKDVVERSKDTLIRGQLAAEAGNNLLAGQSIDSAELLVKLAYAKAEEREAAEKTATLRAELKSLENRIDGFLRGKEQ